MMKIEIKNWEALSLYEVYDILRLRGEVFVVGQQCTCVDPDGKDPSAFHLMMHDGEKLIGYARLFPPGIYLKDASSLGRVALLKDYRNRGLGKEIMKQSINFFKENYPGIPLIISAQSYLEKFYRNLGFKTVSEAYLEENMPHVRMKLNL